MTNDIDSPTVFDPLRAVASRFGRADRPGVCAFRSTDVAEADDHGLLGVVASDVAEGGIVLDEDAEIMLDTLLRRATAEAVALEATTAAAVGALRAAGIETRVLKGVAVAHLDYPLPELRQFGDIDVLVRGPDMAGAVSVLGAVGFVRHYAEPYEGFDEFIGKGVAVENPDRTVVDLHRTLALGWFGTHLDTEQLWSNGEEFVLGSVPMHALGRSERFVHCALHMALSPTVKIANGLDLCMIGGGAVPLSTADVVDTARRWGCTDPLARSVQATTAWFGEDWAPPGLIDWAHAHHRSIRDGVAMAAFVGRFSSSRMRSLTAIAGLRSPRLVGRAMRGLLVHGHGEHE